jgi:rhamnosyl/mannosyltransferase
LIRRENPDVAHLHFPYPLGELANHFFGHARKTVITYHSDIIRQKYLRVAYAPLLARVLARADRIIASSPNYIASSPVLARYKNKCVVVPLGIDPTPFEISPSGSLSYGEKDRVRLLFVGHLRYYKGVNYLIEAMPETPRAQLTIVGSGPMERAWRELAQRLNVSERVTFAGEVSDAELPGYYAASDIFVLPASERSEAFGAVQLEAMASGKPVVCTELGTGTSFVNVNEETGLVVPARDSDALARAINRLIDDPALRARMGAAGRARVRDKFTLEKMVDQVMQVYTK